VGARLRLHPECSHSSDGAPTEGRPYKVLTQAPPLGGQGQNTVKAKPEIL
jgi:hypothetical protein